MRRRIGKICILTGAVLVAMALALLLYNIWEARQAEKASADVMEKITDYLQEEDQTEPDNSHFDERYYWDEEKTMKTVKIDGYDYIGYLSIPSLDLTLPVMAQWSYPGLKIAPGRYFGSVYDDNLVIAGHNYARHFSPIKWLEEGTKVTFTDMEEVEWNYEVMETETLAPAQVEEMTGKQTGDAWDLTLFTCNTGGQTRCAVRCRRIG